MNLVMRMKTRTKFLRKSVKVFKTYKMTNLVKVSKLQTKVNNVVVKYQQKPSKSNKKGDKCHKGPKVGRDIGGRGFDIIDTPLELLKPIENSISK